MRAQRKSILFATFLLFVVFPACAKRTTSLSSGAPTTTVVGRTLTCAASTAQPSLSIPVNSAGAPIGSVNFTILVNSNYDAFIDQVLLNGLELPPILPAPVGLSRSHAIVVPVSTLGGSQLQIKTFSEGDRAECTVLISTVGQVVPGPMIAAFTASSTMVDIGSSIDLTAQLSGGQATSLQIANSTVAINNGSGTFRVTPSSTGASTYRAVVQGPGGSHESTITVYARPTCTIRATNSVGVVGSSMAFDITIAGGYTSGRISGNGVQSLDIPAAQTSFRSNVMVTAATGAQPIYLDLIASGGLTARCQDNVTLVAPSGPPPAAPRCTLETPSGPNRIEGNNLYMFFTIEGAYNSGAIVTPGLTTIPIVPGLNHGATWPLVNQALGPQTSVMTLNYGNGLSVTCSTPVNLLPNSNPPSVSFTIDGSDVSGRYFRDNQVVRFQWSSSGADSCEFGQIGLNLPNTLSGSMDVVIRASQGVRFKCIKSSPNGNYWAYKDITYGISY